MRAPDPCVRQAAGLEPRHRAPARPARFRHHRLHLARALLRLDRHAAAGHRDRAQLHRAAVHRVARRLRRRRQVPGRHARVGGRRIRRCVRDSRAFVRGWQRHRHHARAAFGAHRRRGLYPPWPSRTLGRAAARDRVLLLGAGVLARRGCARRPGLLHRDHGSAGTRAGHRSARDAGAARDDQGVFHERALDPGHAVVQHGDLFQPARRLVAGRPARLPRCARHRAHRCKRRAGFGRAGASRAGGAGDGRQRGGEAAQPRQPQKQPALALRHVHAR